jgi:hypothetical protein
MNGNMLGQYSLHRESMKKCLWLEGLLNHYWSSLVDLVTYISCSFEAIINQTMYQIAPCSFELFSQISSHSVVFFSHNKPANSTFSHSKPAKRTGCRSLWMGICWTSIHFTVNPGKVLVGSSQPLLIVVSRPCDRSFEARESALVNILCYISDIWAYEMNDLHFSDYVVRHHEVLRI